MRGVAVGYEEADLAAMAWRRMPGALSTCSAMESYPQCVADYWVLCIAMSHVTLRVVQLPHPKGLANNFNLQKEYYAFLVRLHLATSDGPTAHWKGGGGRGVGRD